MAILSREEIDNIERQHRRQRDDLSEYQQYVYEEIESFRNRHGLRVIRSVIPRDSVKSVDSIVDKIIRKREQGRTEYGYDNIDDLVGVKIICPYLSSARKVSRWLCTNDNFGKISAEGMEVRPDGGSIDEDTFQKLLTEAKKQYGQGYRGIHFIVEALAKKDPGWAGLECEVQVKTMCQEAWDAMTHDTTYKSQHTVDSAFVEHMRQLSRVLSAVDQQGETIRKQIEHRTKEDRERKRAAALSLLMSSRVRSARDEIGGVPIGSIKSPDDLSPDQITSLTEEIGQRRRAGAINELSCFLAGVAALCSNNPKHKTLAYQTTQQFVEQHPENSSSLDMAATICWSLNRYSDAVRYGEEAVSNLSDDGQRRTDLIGNLTYWVADATKAGAHVDDESKRVAADFVDQALNEDSLDESSNLDSAGFARLVFAQSVPDAEDGLRLLDKSWDAIESEDSDIIRLANRFIRRHRVYGYQKLSRLTGGR